ncbi:MAG: hypothetical protein ABWK01_07200 [Infirmifilum sp.]
MEKEFENGLKMLSSASIIMLVAYIVTGIDILLMPFLRVYTLIMPPRLYVNYPRMSHPFVAIIAVAIALAGVGLGLYAVLAKLSKGLDLLGQWKGDIKGVSPLAVWGLAAGLILLGISSILLPLTLPGRAIALVLSYLSLLLGYVGLGTIVIKLGTYLNSSTFTLAGAFSIISALIPLFAPITWLVLFIEANTQAVRAGEAPKQ